MRSYIKIMSVLFDGSFLSCKWVIMVPIHRIALEVYHKRESDGRFSFKA